MTSTPRSRLPAQVLDFLEHFAEYGDEVVAAVHVGVHPLAAPRFARQALDSSDAREAFDQIMRTRFAQAAPLSLKLLIDMVQSKAYGERVRLEAARTLLDRSGYSVKALAAPAAAPDLHEMSPDELRRMISTTEAELAERAKLVDHVAIDAPIDTQVIDMEE